MAESNVDLVNKVFISWNLHRFKQNYKPTEHDEDLANQFLCQIILKKLKWANVDVVIPDELLMILLLCSETPADIQMLTVDMLDHIKEMSSNKAIPVGYVITPEDFIGTFSISMPVLSENTRAREEYNKKWDMQKLYNREDITMYGTDNMFDTRDFWKAFANV